MRERTHEGKILAMRQIWLPQSDCRYTGQRTCASPKLLLGYMHVIPESMQKEEAMSRS